MEAIDAVERVVGKSLSHEYVDENRRGDHICYISNLSKIKAHFPGWNVSRSLDAIIREIASAQSGRG
jgi:CDP-paratose 2-epimerase